MSSSIYKTVTIPEMDVEVSVDLDDSDVLEAVEEANLGIEDFVTYMIFDEDDMAEYLLVNGHDSVTDSEEVDRLKAENEKLKNTIKQIYQTILASGFNPYEGGA